MQYQDYLRTQQMIEDTLSKPLPGKIKQTYEILNKFLIELSPLVFTKSVFDKFIPFLRIYKIGKLAVVFVIDLVEIWT